MKNPDRNIWALDAIAEASAELAHEDGPPTRDERVREAKYVAFVAERIAALRRAAFAQIEPVVIAPRPVRPSILAMARAEVMARLEGLRAAHPQAVLGFAHHKHRGGEMSDDDLRTALEDAERAIESG